MPDITTDQPESWVSPTDDLDSAPGVLGVLGTRLLGDLAGEAAEIGRSSHTDFGDRIVAVAALLAVLAREAIRRLSEDRLPEGARPTPPPAEEPPA
jgi:hypothetical protein